MELKQEPELVAKELQDEITESIKQAIVLPIEVALYKVIEKYNLIPEKRNNRVVSLACDSWNGRKVRVVDNHGNVSVEIYPSGTTEPLSVDTKDNDRIITLNWPFSLIGPCEWGTLGTLTISKNLVDDMNQSNGLADQVGDAFKKFCRGDWETSKKRLGRNNRHAIRCNDGVVAGSYSMKGFKPIHILRIVDDDGTVSTNIMYSLELILINSGYCN